MPDILKDHFVRTVPRGPDLPGPGKHLGEVFVVVAEDGAETMHEWNGECWVSDLKPEAPR